MTKALSIQHILIVFDLCKRFCPIITMHLFTNGSPLFFNDRFSSILYFALIWLWIRNCNNDCGVTLQNYGTGKFERGF